MQGPAAEVHGGITHGVGQALFERAIYDDQGHLLTANLTDYAIPRASDLPEFNIGRMVTPTQHNPLSSPDTPTPTGRSIDAWTPTSRAMA